MPKCIVFLFTSSSGLTDIPNGKRKARVTSHDKTLLVAYQILILALAVKLERRNSKLYVLRHAVWNLLQDVLIRWLIEWDLWEGFIFLRFSVDVFVSYHFALLFFSFLVFLFLYIMYHLNPPGLLILPSLVEQLRVAEVCRAERVTALSVPLGLMCDAV